MGNLIFIQKNHDWGRKDRYSFLKYHGHMKQGNPILTSFRLYIYRE